MLPLRRTGLQEPHINALIWVYCSPGFPQRASLWQSGSGFWPEAQQLGVTRWQVMPAQESLSNRHHFVSELKQVRVFPFFSSLPPFLQFFVLSKEKLMIYCPRYTSNNSSWTQGQMKAQRVWQRAQACFWTLGSEERGVQSTLCVWQASTKECWDL